MSDYKFNVGDRVKYIGPCEYSFPDYSELGTVTGLYSVFEGGHLHEYLRVHWDEDAVGCTRSVLVKNVVKQFPKQNPDEMTVGEFKKFLEQYADDVVMSKVLSEIFNCSY